VTAEADAETERRGSALRFLAGAFDGNNDEKSLGVLTWEAMKRDDTRFGRMAEFTGEDEAANLGRTSWRMREEDMGPDTRKEPSRAQQELDLGSSSGGTPPHSENVLPRDPSNDPSSARQLTGACRCVQRAAAVGEAPRSTNGAGMIGSTEWTGMAGTNLANELN
jgi:hypothetical protein